MKGGNSMDFKDAKQRKERGYSVKQAVADLNESADSYETIIIIGKTSDNELEFGYSGGNDAELIGQLEVLKAVLIERIQEA